MSEPINDEKWSEFTLAVAKAAKEAGVYAVALTAFAQDAEDEDDLWSRGGLITPTGLSREAREELVEEAIQEMRDLDFADDSDVMTHRLIDDEAGTNDVDQVVEEAKAFLGDACEKCGGEKRAIDPPEGAIELRDTLSRTIIDSGLVEIANFNLVFKNGCEDVNITPACGCGDTTGKCFAHGSRMFAMILEDVAAQAEAGKGFASYDGEGSEKWIEPPKH